MKQFNRHISMGASKWLRVMLAAVVASAAASCAGGHDEPELPMAEEEASYEFTLQVSVGDNVAFASSLATAEGYDPGKANENQIDFNGRDYRLYVCNSANVVLKAVDPDSVSLLPIIVDDEVGAKKYELRFLLGGEVAKSLNPISATFKLLMIANWGTYPSGLVEGTSTIDNIMASSACLKAYNSAITEPGPGKLIPMFGVNLFSSIHLDDQGYVEIGQMHLLRAMAKIEVFDDLGSGIDDPAGSGALISAVHLSRHATSLWCAPKLPHYLQSDYMASPRDYAYDYGQGFRPYATESDTPLAFAKDANGHFILYVPEYANLAEGAPRPEAQRARIIITYADGRTGDVVEFKYYDSVNAERNGASLDDHFDIRRNYWYRYCVHKGSVVTTMRVDQVPFVTVALDPLFGFDDPLVKDEDDQWVLPPWVEIEQ